jgi:hypothetical protein
VEEAKIVMDDEEGIMVSQKQWDTKKKSQELVCE